MPQAPARVRKANSRAVAKAATKQMSEQQQQFVDHFLRFGNATQAAKAAGYAHPDAQAIRLLAKPHIRKYLQDASVAKAMSFAPDVLDELANIALDRENTQPKDRIAAAVAILDRAQIPNGRTGTSINIDQSTKTANVVVGGQEVAQLIAETWMRGRGQLPPNEPQPLQIEDQSGDGEEPEDAEFEEPDEEDGDETNE